ncbi:PssD/Cps14F family polysaccharide biosynthesis glycosyltransferase [Leuconostoc lactis]|uniref:PssD/Cps14F family polysaccharide biosynthesis glycosyltransferase n=1 Tax=Leuconostoc lactis TaxID=1246 RepID=UPI0025AFF706|nr:PssD/Cps14F family polysaccharide biosynthesis glycosyltransferase [Leuconostoc lactis]MDN2649365.1 polysaccharide biosynthesis protein [Leuconostoc lactis]
MESKQLSKVCLTSSSGGHLQELMTLKLLADYYEVFYITEKDQFSTKNLGKQEYRFSKIDRKEKNFLIHFLKISLSIFKILRNEKPDVVISTGALVTVPVCVLGKILGSKVIYIESFARVSSLSLTGKLLYFWVDKFIVQWPDLEKKYSKASYIGGVF